MQTESNKAAVREAVERFNARDIDAYLGLYAPDVVAHGYTPQPIDLAGMRVFYESVWSAFADATVTLEEALAEGDLLAARYTFRGTHEGEFMGVPATGRTVEVAGQTFLRFSGGRVVERWQSFDAMGLMIQLGAIPAPA